MAIITSKIRIYPTKQQEALLNRACMDRFHFYNSLVLWYNSTKKSCMALYSSFCSKELDEEKRSEYSKTLPWPSRKLTKEGLNDTCLRVVPTLIPRRIRKACVHYIAKVSSGKDKGKMKDYGVVFRLNELYFRYQFGEPLVAASAFTMTKEDFAKAVTKTYSSSKNVWVAYSKYKEADSFRITYPAQTEPILENRKIFNDQASKVNIPFLSGVYRKKLGKELEWFKCAFNQNHLLNCSSVKTGTVVRNKAGEWFVCLTVEKEESISRQETGLECGIDLGVKTTATIAVNSVGEQSPEYDKFLKEDLPINKIKLLESKVEFLTKQNFRRIKTWLRLNSEGVAKGLSMNVSKGDRAHSAVCVYLKRYKSGSYRRTEDRIKKLQNDIVNIRKDFVEKFSTKLVKEYDSIGLEDLNVKGMMKKSSKEGFKRKKSKLSRSIARIGFYNLRVRIESKAGKERVFYLNRFAPSSKLCSYCGYKKIDLKLKDRSWICPICGHKHDRDENASSNIRPSRKETTESYILKK